VSLIQVFCNVTFESLTRPSTVIETPQITYHKSRPSLSNHTRLHVAFVARPRTLSPPRCSISDRLSTETSIHASLEWVLQVSGVTISSKSLSDIRKRLSGPPGTEVMTCTYAHNTHHTHTHTHTHTCCSGIFKKPVY